MNKHLKSLIIHYHLWYTQLLSHYMGNTGTRLLCAEHITLCHLHCHYLCSGALQRVFVEFGMGFIWLVLRSYLFKYQFFVKEEWKRCRDALGFFALPEYRDTEIKLLFVFQQHARASYL